jgi:hypothetical protein
LPRISRPVAIGEGRIARDNGHFREPRQVGRQVLGDAVCEILLFAVVAQIDEGQDHYRQARCSGRGSDRHFLPERTLALPGARNYLDGGLVISTRDRGHPSLAHTLKPPLAHLSSERQVITRPSKREIRSQAELPCQRLCRSFCFPLHRRRGDKQSMRQSVLRGFVHRVKHPLDAFGITPGGKMSERRGE